MEISYKFARENLDYISLTKKLIIELHEKQLNKSR